MLKLNTKNTIDKPTKEQLEQYSAKIKNIYQGIDKQILPGSRDWMGWRTYPFDYPQAEFARMVKKADEWKKDKVEYVVVIGIGGSFLGIKAAIDMCTNHLKEKLPKIIWVHNIGSNYLTSVLNQVEGKKFAIVVISKSGTTLEPAVSFRLFREKLEKQVGFEKASKYIVAVTDYDKGTLHDFAQKKKYSMFGIPNDIGGRFSTLTPVGMFVIILAGLDYKAMLAGAQQAYKDTQSPDLKKNSAALYAVYRDFYYSQKKLAVENFVVYDPYYSALGEQWKQIFGESEGKGGFGLYLGTSLFTTDLHSMGQFFQEGTRSFFETTLHVLQPKCDKKIVIKDDDDKLKFLNGKTINEIDECAFLATVSAHTKIGKTNNLVIELDNNDEFHYGYLFYWWSMTVTVNAYLFGVNPFNQPGVEAYKKEMFELLKK
ncbi:MAG: glucose-6-phosphate isomerase [Mycoplasmataceae bacterium]|nr:glucose-6-phosphate isomerase [Mycoplasmataceae bacterium]